MFGNLGFGELLLIGLVILLLFGAKRIPDLMGSMGKGIREFKSSMNDIGSTEVRPPTDRPGLRSPDGTSSADAKDEARPEPKRLI